MIWKVVKNAKGLTNKLGPTMRPTCMSSPTNGLNARAQHACGRSNDSRDQIVRLSKWTGYDLTRPDVDDHVMDGQ